MKLPPVKLTNTSAYILTKKKTEFRDTYRRNGLKARSTLRYTSQTEENIKQRPIGTVYSILCITDSSSWRSFVRIGSENKAAENPTNSNKTNSNCLKASPLGHCSGKINELKIGIAFGYHIYELLKFSLAQIRNGFQDLTIGIQQRQT